MSLLGQVKSVRISGRINPDTLEDGAIDYGVSDGSGAASVRVARVLPIREDGHRPAVEFLGITVEKSGDYARQDDIQVARGLLQDCMR